MEIKMQLRNGIRERGRSRMAYYLYENHMGGMFYTYEERDYEDMYCETCGDSDWFMGTFETEEELKDLMGDKYCEEDMEGLLKEFRAERADK